MGYNSRLFRHQDASHVQRVEVYPAVASLCWYLYPWWGRHWTVVDLECGVEAPRWGSGAGLGHLGRFEIATRVTISGNPIQHPSASCASLVPRTVDTMPSSCASFTTLRCQLYPTRPSITYCQICRHDSKAASTRPACRPFSPRGSHSSYLRHLPSFLRSGQPYVCFGRRTL